MLKNFLTSPERPEGTLSYHETQVFFYAITCSPELIAPSEWLPLIFNEHDAEYASQDEAQAVIQDLLALYNVINTQVVTINIGLPDDIELQQSALDNAGEDTMLGHWSRGFFKGHNWLIELWDHYTPDTLQDELASSLMVMSFFTSRRIAEDFYAEVASTSDKTLDEFADTMLTMFDDAMLISVTQFKRHWLISNSFNNRLHEMTKWVAMIHAPVVVVRSTSAVVCIDDLA